MDSLLIRAMDGANDVVIHVAQPNGWYVALCGWLNLLIKG